MNLYLIRHGHAESYASAGGSDAERALTTQGRALLQHAAPLMLRVGIAPTLILTSPFRRARETADILASSLGPQQGVSVEPYLASGALPEELLESARPYDDLPGVLLVGHNPEIDALVRSLAAKLDVTPEPMMPATLVWFHHPFATPATGLAFQGQWHIDGYL